LEDFFKNLIQNFMVEVGLRAGTNITDQCV
jgi:hypothetical protein